MASRCAVGVVVALVCGVWATEAWADVGSLADSNGQVAAWGSNSNGQINVPAGESFKAIAAGAWHSLGLHTDGTLAAWGSNAYGLLNVPSGTFTDIAAVTGHNLAVRTDGTLAAWGSNAYGPLNVPTGTFTDVAAGNYFSLAIRTDGTLAAWGDNTYHQLDVPSGTFKDIAAGYGHSLGLRTDGTLAGWGWNWAGQINVPSGTFTDIAAGTDHSLAIRTDGALAAWGSHGSGETTVPSGTFTDVAGGSYFSLGLRTDGTLAGWGRDLAGAVSALPSGTFVAVAAGSNHGLALYARTNYDNLVVNGQGVSDTASWLNRDVTVAGNATIDSMMYAVNNPTMTVGGNITLGPTGGIDGDGIFRGQFDGKAGSSIHLTSGGALEGSGTLRGNFSGEAGSTITATGTLKLGIHGNLVSVVHNGALNIGSQRVELWTDFGGATLGGATTIAGGLLRPQYLTLTDTATVTGYGTLAGLLYNHGVVTGAGGTLSVGWATGEGSFLGTVEFLGDYYPGEDRFWPGACTLGDPTFTSDAWLLMDIDGLDQGTLYDHLDILGTAHLGGELNVFAGNPAFVLGAGNSFDLFDGNLSGMFDTLTLPGLAPGLFWDWSTLYTDGVIRVEGTPPAVPVPGALALCLLGLGTARGLLRRTRS